MKITIYELLGLIKDGKAPKKIYFNCRVYELDDYNHYMNECKVGFNFEYTDLFDETLNVELENFLNDEVEIIEEENEIEKLDITDRIKWEDCTPLTVEIMAKINELIDEIKKLKEQIK